MLRSAKPRSGSRGETSPTLRKMKHSHAYADIEKTYARAKKANVHKVQVLRKRDSRTKPAKIMRLSREDRISRRNQLKLQRAKCHAALESPKLDTYVGEQKHEQNGEEIDEEISRQSSELVVEHAVMSPIPEQCAGLKHDICPPIGECSNISIHQESRFTSDTKKPNNDKPEQKVGTPLDFPVAVHITTDTDRKVVDVIDERTCDDLNHGHELLLKFADTWHHDSKDLNDSSTVCHQERLDGSFLETVYQKHAHDPASLDIQSRNCRANCGTKLKDQVHSVMKMDARGGYLIEWKLIWTLKSNAGCEEDWIEERILENYSSKSVRVDRRVFLEEEW